jgi:uncharacterized integral membrane protein
MRLVKLFLTIIILAVILWFLALNVDTTVRQIQIFTITLQNVNLVHVMLASFLIGVLVGFLIPVMEILSVKAEARKFERQSKKLQNELNDLRNVAIEEDLQQLPGPAEGEDELETEQPEKKNE